MADYKVYENVRLGKNVSIHPYAVIGKPPKVPSATTTYKPDLQGAKTVIGDGCVIGAGAVIYQGCTVGEETLVGDGARLRDRATIGDNCIIGMGTKIGPRTVIGDRVKIMDLCNIAGNMLIEDDVFVAQGTMCANDKYMGRTAPKQVENYAEKGPTIRRFATVGMNSSILPGVEIGENAVVGAGSVVTKDVRPHTVVMGIAAQEVRDLLPSERCERRRRK